LSLQHVEPKRKIIEPKIFTAINKNKELTKRSKPKILNKSRRKLKIVNMKKTYKLIMALLVAFGFMILNSCTDEATPSPTPPPTTGDAMFWIASDLGVGPITVYCNGSSQTFNSYYSSGAPSCGASGAANFSLNPGTYPFTASAGSSTWSGSITVTAGGCSKMQLTGGGGGGGSSTNGNVMFWTKNSTLGAITVNFNGQVKQITQYQSSGNPSGCGVSGFANYNLAAGTYSYTASSASGVKWAGSVNVPTNNGCFLQELTYSDTGGGGSTTGNLVVWEKNDNGGGTSTITVNGQKGYITSVYPNATLGNPPPCGATGCATFYNLAPGNYTVYHSNALGNSTGQAVVVAGACNSLLFN
jgi:major membrane immunogen (membrane-anchored lipoprotein)